MIMQKDKNFYNIIAYIFEIISFIIMFILIIDEISFHLINSKTNFILITIGVSCGSLYYKLHTIPITEAISHYWKYKVLKQDKTKSNNNEDYASFKDNQNENNPT